MISAGLVSPDAASSATWFDKISWSAWAENGSAPLLNEYENYANDTSFEELFEKSWYEWSDTCKTAFAFWAFGAAEKYVDYMQNWHKISCVPEDYNVHFNINDNSGNHKNLSNYSPKEISGMKRNELKRLLPNGWDFQEHNGRIHIRDEKGNFRIRIDPPDPKTNYTHIHIYDANNNCLDIDGNIVSNKSPSGHIPYNN